MTHAQNNGLQGSAGCLYTVGQTGFHRHATLVLCVGFFFFYFPSPPLRYLSCATWWQTPTARSSFCGWSAGFCAHWSLICLTRHPFTSCYCLHILHAVARRCKPALHWFYLQINSVLYKQHSSLHTVTCRWSAWHGICWSSLSLRRSVYVFSQFSLLLLLCVWHAISFRNHTHLRVRRPGVSHLLYTWAGI